MVMELQDKTVVIGVCGGIAAYKACEIVSSLRKSGCNVFVVMTKNSCHFVSKLTFETLSQNRVAVDMFDGNHEWEVEHIALSKKADLFVIVPATANIIAKINRGIADDMLSTTIMAAKCPVIICPAMHSAMYFNINFQENLNSLQTKGYIIIEPESGRLACGDTGIGRLASIDVILENISKQLLLQQDFCGKTILVTAGATIEDIDKIRFISNHSSGKMGCEIARAAKERGAKVILIAGKITVKAPDVEVIYVSTTQEMRDSVMGNLSRADIIIKAAAPSDYKVINKSENKIKSEKLILELKKNPDIAKEVGKVKGSKKLIIFCAETENLLENAKEKIENKNADLIIANDVTKEGAGFNSDTNIVTFIDKDGSIEDLEIMTKYKLAHKILDKILTL